MKISDYKPQNAIMAMFKGISGTGKTTACASFPEPIYWLDTDGRMASIANSSTLRDRDIEFDTYTDFNKIVDKLSEFRNQCKYPTIVMDSLTSTARIVQNFLYDNRGTWTSSDGKKSKPMVGGLIPIMDIAEYSGETNGLNMIAQLLKVIRIRHKVNVILVAHVVQTDVTTLDGTVKQHRRIVTGGNKIASEIPTYFDEQYHFKTDSGVLDTAPTEYICITKSDTLDYATTSIQGMPKSINWTNKLFYDEIKQYFPVR